MEDDKKRFVLAYRDEGKWVWFGVPKDNSCVDLEDAYAKAVQYIHAEFRSQGVKCTQTRKAFFELSAGGMKYKVFLEGDPEAPVKT